MALPQGIKFTYEGSSQLFLRRMASITNHLEDLFTQIRKVGLEASTRNVKGVRIVEFQEAGADLASYNPQTDTVNIYPMSWTTGARFDVPFYAGFGLRHWIKNLAPQQRVWWLQKAVMLDPLSCKAVAVHFDGRTEYQRILPRITVTSDKFTAWALVQLLTDGGIDFKDLRTIDLATLPQTAEYFNGRKAFNIKPLIQRHSGGMLSMSSYEGAFASFVANNGRVGLVDQAAGQAMTALFIACSRTNLSDHGTLR